MGSCNDDDSAEEDEEPEIKGTAAAPKGRRDEREQEVKGWPDRRLSYLANERARGQTRRKLLSHGLSHRGSVSESVRQADAKVMGE